MESAIKVIRGAGIIFASEALQRISAPFTALLRTGSASQFEQRLADILNDRVDEKKVKRQEFLPVENESTLKSNIKEVYKNSANESSQENKGSVLISQSIQIKNDEINEKAKDLSVLENVEISFSEMENSAYAKNNNDLSVSENLPLSMFSLKQKANTVNAGETDLKKELNAIGKEKRVLGKQSRERRVPSTTFGRAIGFAGVGASLAYSMAKDTLSSSLFGSDPEKAANSKGVMSERNAEALAAGLCRMRGAALKLGQMLSIQDETVIPPHIQSALERVRAGADYMPQRQLENVLRVELGGDWMSKVSDFDFVPMAAASIGQVHSALLKNGKRVAIKVQYPGVAKSIESDMENLMTLMKVADVLPKGLYVDTLVRVMKKELSLECDYSYEMRSQQKFKSLVEADSLLRNHFRVPDVYPELSSQKVLTSEWVPGVSIDKVCNMSDEVRNVVGTRLLHMTLKELFQWRFMQTDPNWGNFLYDPETDILSLIDFGAAREFNKSFVNDYLRMVFACSEKNREEVLIRSTKLGFLTGDENKAMLDAHCEAGFIVGLAFTEEAPYDFGKHSQMTSRVTQLGAIMLKNRLCPPPEESYSLHRKLSGAFLCCMKLRAVVPSKKLFRSIYNTYEFD